VNFTTSAGVSPLPGEPPIVPLMPDIDFINVMIFFDYTDEGMILFFYQLRHCEERSNLYVSKSDLQGGLSCAEIASFLAMTRAGSVGIN
jgi:hypothetical protein